MSKIFFSWAAKRSIFFSTDKKIDLFAAHEKKILDISDELEKQMSEIRAAREAACAQFAEIIKRLDSSGFRSIVILYSVMMK
ncbi:hypothetical protein Q3G72_014282 [Acer saccharum]|nr:hypothetical protein Q3G72_014282 [Acer saccharum]